MPTLGDDYAGDVSDDDIDASRGRRSGGRPRASRDTEKNFEVTRTWDLLTEGADGTITGAVEGLLELNKRKRLLKDTTPLQRGIIRHLILILDMSVAMNEKDLRPTRYLLTLAYTNIFIAEFFEQNPISQLGIVGMRDGIAIRISDMSGNPNDHVTAIQKIRKDEPKGNPSLENALEMSRAALFHAPSHGTREVLLVFGALHTSDPGDIHQTITHLVNDKIQASVIGLAAQVAICAEIVSKTNNGSTANYHVVLQEQHFRELFMSVTTPPVTHDQASSASSLLMMGFPSRTVEAQPSLCACHTRPSREGYLCARCNTKVCSLPSECPVCGLTLILSTHLARSYHHLFPLVNWVEVPWRSAWRSKTCFACGKAFPEPPSSTTTTSLSAPNTTTNGDTLTRRQAQPQQKQKSSSNSSRYECTFCRKHFCIDCDLFAHEVVHNCPGCQSVKSVAEESTLMGEEQQQQQQHHDQSHSEADKATASQRNGMEIDT